MVYNLIFVLPMIWLDFIAPHTGLALASSVAAWQQAIMLYRELAKEDIYRVPATLRTFTLRVVPALVVLAIVVSLTANADWASMDAMGRLLRLLFIIGASVAAYALVLLVSGIRPRQLIHP
jgi:putative peptidoglycan lipid II flippase